MQWVCAALSAEMQREFSRTLTLVVHDQSFRDWTNEVLPCKSMNGDRLSSIAKVAISIASNSSEPKPARSEVWTIYRDCTILGNTGQKYIDSRLGYNGASHEVHAPVVNILGEARASVYSTFSGRLV